MPTSSPGRWSTNWRGCSTAHKKMGPMQQRAPGPPRYATRGNLPVKARHDGEKGKTPSMTRLMPDSHAMDAERPVQPAFRKNGDCSVVYAEGSATFLAIS